MTELPRKRGPSGLRLQDCRLRPLAAGDEARLLAWRNQDRVRINMYRDHVIQADEHARWFASACSFGNAAYLIFEIDGEPTGFVSFVDIDRSAKSCSGGLYIGEEDAPRGSGRALQFLALDYAFQVIGVVRLSYEVFVFNRAAVKLYEEFGFVERGHRTGPNRKDGQPSDVVILSRSAETWQRDRPALAAAVFQEHRA